MVQNLVYLTPLFSVYVDQLLSKLSDKKLLHDGKYVLFCSVHPLWRLCWCRPHIYGLEDVVLWVGTFSVCPWLRTRWVCITRSIHFLRCEGRINFVSLLISERYGPVRSNLVFFRFFSTSTVIPYADAMGRLPESASFRSMFSSRMTSNMRR